MTILLDGVSISEIVLSVTLEKTLRGAAQTAVVTALRPTEDFYFRKINPACAMRVTVEKDGAELFAGRVERARFSADGQTVTLTCLDGADMLCKNELYGVFSGTAAAVTQNVCARLGLSVGTLWQRPGAVFLPPSSGLTGFEIIRRAYADPVLIAMRGGRITTEKPGTRAFAINADMLLSAECEHSSEDVVNRVSVIGYGGSVQGTAENAQSAARYGARASVLSLAGAKSGAAAQASGALRGMTERASIVIPGELGAFAGAGVTMNAPVLGITGRYVATAVRHTAAGGVLTTALELERM